MLVDRIAQETGVSVASLEAIIDTASRRYKTYTILKRNGGLREINHPTPVIKFLQRWVVRNVISALPVHSSVMSYRSGVGISQNAEIHVAQNYLMKMDFADFFPSIKNHDIKALLLANRIKPLLVDLAEQDIDTVLNIVCRNGQLTIGAPSSPAISNAILYTFDEIISENCRPQGVFYTRYADDISFSTNGPNVLSKVRHLVENTLRDQLSPRLHINDDKTSFTSKKRRRSVTGLTLTSENKISIGREKKREIRTLCYQFLANELSPERVAYLRGYLSFVRSVEPSFIESLRSKYGSDTIERIFDAVLIGLK